MKVAFASWVESSGVLEHAGWSASTDAPRKTRTPSAEANLVRDMARA
jgi:hypothetical protein